MDQVSDWFFTDNHEIKTVRAAAQLNPDHQVAFGTGT